MSFWTWNPNHSEQVRAILDHATEAEQTRFVRLSAVGGLVLALGCVVVIAPIVAVATVTGMQTFTQPQWFIAMAGMPLAFVGVVLSIGVIRRWVRNMLVDFEWAKEQGITKDTLKLDRWG